MPSQTAVIFTEYIFWSWSLWRVTHDEYDVKVQVYENGIVDIPSFHLRDNYVHVQECSPFSVGIFVMFKK